MTQNQKIALKNVKLKEIIAIIDINLISELINIPSQVMLKSVKTNYAYNDGKRTDTVSSQTLTVASGTSLADIEILDVTYIGQPILEDNITALIGSMIELSDITLAPIANMRGRDFQGFSATGLKLVVARIAPFSENEK